MTEDLSLVLADVGAAAAARTGTPHVAAAVIRTLVDWFGVAVGGSASPPVSALADGLTSTRRDVRVVGGPDRFASMETAALLNGTAAHALELDDIYAPGLYHPGAPTIAAALAAAERVDATGAQFMQGVVAGIEVGCRVATDLGPDHYRHWHTTGTVGAIGSAVAAGTVMGLSRDQVAHAISVSGTMAAGLQQTFRRDGVAKPLHAGHAAQSGVIAATGAARGLTGALDILEGSSGLAAATGVETAWDASRATVGDELRVERLSVKPYPCCGHTFAAVDAAFQLRERGVLSEEVTSIHVDTYETAVRTAGIPEPRQPAEARFSIPYAVAVGLRDGRLTAASFEEPRLSHPDLERLVRRTTLAAHADFERAFPSRRGARVVVTLAGGTQHESTVPDRRGSPENPLDEDSLRAKFDDLAIPVLGSARAASLHDALQDIGSARSVRDLL